MNILHIATGFDLDFNGGITNYVRAISSSQAANGHMVFVLCDGGKSNQYEIIKLCSFSNAWGFSNKNNNKQLKQLENILINKKIDFVHIHMMLNLDQRIWKVLQKNRIKYVVSLHDYWFICPRIKMVHGASIRCVRACDKKCYKCFSIFEGNYFMLRAFRKIFGQKALENFPIKLKFVYKNWIDNTRKLLENADMLLPVSTRVEEIYKGSGIKGKYRTIHIGNITADCFDFDYVYHHQEKINLVLLSSLNVLKGGELFSKIFKNVHNSLIRVHFWGRASEHELQLFEGTDFVNHGKYNQTELPGILNSMDMGVMTPIWEDNGPQVVMEMINNHLPVFATKMGGITDFVNSSNGFLFDPFSEKEVDLAIDFLNNLSFDQIEKMKNSIKPTETTSHHFAEIMEVYKAVMAERIKKSV